MAGERRSGPRHAWTTPGAVSVSYYLLSLSVDPTEFVISGPLLLAMGLSALAGVVSFASPCVIPLVPGYLAYLAGLVGASAPDEVPDRAGKPVPAGASPSASQTSTSSVEPVEGPATARDARQQAGAGRWRVAGAALLFVLGFTVVFMLATVSLLGLSETITANEVVLQRVGGVITIAMGLVFLGLVPALQRDLRFHRVRRDGLLGAPLLGGVFALGWTPCLGPTLTGVLSFAIATQGDGGVLTRGVTLVAAYCLGLGLPFVLLAVGAGWAVRSAGWLRRNTRRIQLAGGVMMIVVGVLLVTGTWNWLIGVLRGPISGFELPL
ncbi:cytochrome c-type biogenesis protein [Actinoalloteichus cyanogriseus DSM 43889]|uniref:Cytochrome c-type biogenesis protein n=1 Tax=Actinoalloteichus caeruleus DSM 43889 TaxID=1120930 RepID=A0ABT1JLE6_ACTCY|nr:cytochrome c-type biogenesis protein [Actinoalloteichus caeruleus DSM 43889]